MMKALEGSTRIAFLIFFASHIVFTVGLDGQVLLGGYYPRPLQRLAAWYPVAFHDILMAAPTPLWLQSLIACELLLQLPYFVAACAYLADPTRAAYPQGFRYACIAYGAHTATTLVPILSAFALYDDFTAFERSRLLALYLPYLLFPLGILWAAVTAPSVTEPADLKKKE
jgi:EXPERA (EXPanded EBP superfamily)